MKRIFTVLIWLASALIAQAQFQPTSSASTFPWNPLSDHLRLTFGSTTSLTIAPTDPQIIDRTIEITNSNGSVVYAYGVPNFVRNEITNEWTVTIRGGVDVTPPNITENPVYASGITVGVRIKQHTFKDANNNLWPSSDILFPVTTGNNLPPSMYLETESPVKDYNVSYYLIYVNEVVTKGTGQIEFRNLEHPERSVSIDVTSPSVIFLTKNFPGTDVPRTVIMVRPDPLLSDQVFGSDPYDQYQVFVPVTAIKDQINIAIQNPYLSDPFEVQENIIINPDLDIKFISENMPIGTKVGNLFAEYPSAVTLQASVTNNPSFPDNINFGTFGTNGLELRSKAKFDFETKNTYTIEVEFRNLQTNLKTRKTFVVGIADQNPEAPQVTQLNPANSPFKPLIPSTSVRSVLRVKFNQKIFRNTGTIAVYRTSNDALVGAYNVASSTAISIYNDSTLIIDTPDLLAGTGYYVLIPNNAILGFAGFTTKTSWQFVTPDQIQGVNAPSGIALSQNSIFENNSSGQFIGELTATDPDFGEVFDFYFTDTGTKTSEDGNFVIIKTPFATWPGLNANRVFDFEEKSSYTIDITVEDSDGNRRNQPFTISILNGTNEPPVAIVFTKSLLFEGNQSGDLVGTFTTEDTPGDSHTYTLISGIGAADNGKFFIEGNTLKAGAVFDYNTQNEFSIRVRTTDAGGLRKDQVFEIGLNQTFNQNAIVRLQQTVSFPTPANSIFAIGKSINLTASASSGLPVEFFVESGKAFMLNGMLSIVGAGEITVSAIQQGNFTYEPAKTTVSFTVEKGNQTITLTGPATKTFGDAPFAVSASSNIPNFQVTLTTSNPAVLSYNGTNFTVVSAGTATITASHPGSNDFNPAQKTLEVTVNKAVQTITFATITSKIFGDAAFQVSPSSSSGLPVVLESSNTSVATVVGNTITIVGAGTTNITASQMGNANYLAAPNVIRALTVAKASQTITFENLPSAKFGDPNRTLSATTSSGLAVQYASSNPAIAEINGNTLVIKGVGTANITASQAGNTNYNAATNVVRVFTVAKGDQTITFQTVEAPYLEAGQVNLVATSSSGLPVSFSILSGEGSINGNTLAFSIIGEITVRASQPGDAQFNPAPDVDQLIDIASVTSVTDKQNIILGVWPNPAESELFIDGLSDVPQRVYLTSLDGSILIAREMHNGDNRLDIGILNPGMYLITISSEEGTKQARFIKN